MQTAFLLDIIEQQATLNKALTEYLISTVNLEPDPQPPTVNRLIGTLKAA